MLTYIEGYPLRLPCRYQPRQAMFTKVYIVSNIPLDKQYPNVQREEFDTWEAIKRRITKIKQYKSDGKIEERTVEEEFWFEEAI